MTPGDQLAEFYVAGRERLNALLTGLSDGELSTPVPACPGWSVKDTYAHVVSNPIDGLAGRLSGGPPSEEQTAVQVSQWIDSSVDEMALAWLGASAIDDVIRAAGPAIAPIVIDLHTHEVDIRNALGLPVDTESAFVQWAARRFMADFPAVEVSDFEIFRARLGRRSASQVAAWPWPDGSTPEGFFIFGPRAEDLVE